MLFLAFFSPCTFTTLPTSKTKADRELCREGAVRAGAGGGGGARQVGVAGLLANGDGNA